MFTRACPGAAKPRRKALALLLVVIGLLAWAPLASAGDTPPSAGPAAGMAPSSPLPPGVEDVGVTEKLDGQVPGDATFKDEDGKMVQIGQYFDGKRPTVLILAYHSCKTLCNLVQNSALEAMKGTEWSIGKEYRVITLSIAPSDTVHVAAEKKKSMVAAYGRPGAAEGWHFLTGDAQNISRVADAVGWKFQRDQSGEYAHPTAVMLLKPNGRVARYLYGIDIPVSDMKLGLLEASEGKSITTVERIILYCYHYDPQGRKYSLLATHVMALAGGVTLLLVVGLIGGLFLNERRKSAKRTVPQQDAHAGSS
jgi:protein SCO1/2